MSCPATLHLPFSPLSAVSWHSAGAALHTPSACPLARGSPFNIALAHPASSSSTSCHVPPQINQKIQLLANGKLVDDTPPEQRSPSPEPVYNEYGTRINTREQRLREKLQDRRNVSWLYGRGL